MRLSLFIVSLWILLGCDAAPERRDWSLDRSPERIARVDAGAVDRFRTAEMEIVRHVAELGDPIAQEVLLDRLEQGADADADEAAHWRARIKPQTPQERRRFIHEVMDSSAVFVVARGEDGHPVMRPMLHSAPSAIHAEPELLFELPQGCLFSSIVSFDASGRYAAAQGPSCGPLAVIDLEQRRIVSQPSSGREFPSINQAAFSASGLLRWHEGYSDFIDASTQRNIPAAGSAYEGRPLETPRPVSSELGLSAICGGSFTNAWALATLITINADGSRIDDNAPESIVAVSNGAAIHRATLPFVLSCNLARINGKDRVVVVDAARGAYQIPANGVILIDPASGAMEQRPFRFAFGAPYPVHNARLYLDPGGRSTLGIWDLASNQGGTPRWGGAEQLLLDVATGEISPFLFASQMWPIVATPGPTRGRFIHVSCTDRCRIVFYEGGMRLVVIDAERRRAICHVETSTPAESALTPDGETLVLLSPGQDSPRLRQQVFRWRLPDLCPGWSGNHAD